MKTAALFLTCFAFVVSCGLEAEPYTSCDHNLCEEYDCSGTLGVSIRNHDNTQWIIGADVYIVDAEGRLFGHCATQEGGKNQHDPETGYHFAGGCDITSLPLGIPLAVNVAVNGLVSFAEADFTIPEGMTPHRAAIIHLEEGKY